jgi:Spy/CpxP family protein refolding chaperone
MKFKHLALVAATAGLLTLGVARAQPAEHGHGGWHHDGLEILHGLDLTDAQKAEVHKIAKANWAQMKPIMEQMHSIHEQIVTKLTTTGAVTEADLTPLVQQEETLRSQIDTARLSTVLQVRGLLTPAQLSKAASVHQQLEALHEQERAVVGEPGGAE